MQLINNIYGVIIGLMIMLLNVSCKKALETKPSSNLSTPETLADIQALLDFSILLNERVTPSGPEASSDDYFLTQTSYNSLSANPNAKPYIWEFDPLTFRSDNTDWLSCYRAIGTTNICLEYILKIERTNDNKLQWDNAYGSALFFRSYYFLALCWTYANAYDSASANTDPGIALKETSNINDATVRASVQESYDRVISDTKQALNYLPVTSLGADRPSKAAAYGLLARTYLSMRVYDSAGKYANLCLQISNQLMDFNGDADIVGTVDGSTLSFRRFNKETIFYSEMNFNYPSFFPLPSSSDALVDTSLYALYLPDDLRMVYYYYSNESYHSFKGAYSQRLDPFSGIAVDEMYLTRAECYARMGFTSEALDDVNALLATRWKAGTFVPFTASTSSEALDLILEERRKELVFRGLRWMDIKRLNKEGRHIVLQRFINDQWYELEPNSYKYALPLPPHIITLTGIDQNIGW